METIIKITTKKVVLVIILFIQSTLLFGQYCDSITPSTIVDLSSSPNQSWVSPPLVRDGNCCGTSNPDKCLEFIITLHPSSIAISFNIASGAVPPGALFYQVDCGPITAVGSPICLTGPGPHHLTFCKPGNNTNTFSITSYSEPIIGPSISLNSACTGIIYANYYNEPSITWTSIFPGAIGSYNSLLGCTSGCDTTLVTAPTNPPAYVDYLVCGNDIGGCNPLPICDTIRVNFITPVTVSVSPSAQHLCFGAANTTVTATASGGTAPYNYAWSNGETTASITVGAGTYIVNVTDASGCLVVSDTAIITQDVLPILANAGVDQNVCAQSIPTVQLNGTIQTAIGGIWSGGGGTYSPNNTTLNATYTPTASEVSNGSITLTLTSTGNNGCPASNDNVALNFLNFTETVNLTTTNVTCFGYTNGEAHISTSGTYNPCQFSWNGGALTSDTFLLNLSAGINSVNIINSLGCDTTINFEIFQPTQLTGTVSELDNVCFGESNGEALANAIGGTPPYSYSWNTTPIQDSPLATNLAASSYICTINDGNGCIIQLDALIEQPAQLSLVLASVEPNCYGSSNGAISSAVSGGVSPYLFQWSSGPTSSNLYSLASGSYTLEVTDANNCLVVESIILNQPTQVIGTINNNMVICPNEAIELSVAASGGTGNYQYLWTPNNQTNDTINEIPISNQIYSCEITDNNGCAILLSTSVIINVLNPNDLQAIIGSNEICFLDSVSLIAQYNGSDTSVNLTWVHCPSCSTDDVIYDTPTGDTEYVLSGTNYCGQTIYDTVSIIVNPLPLISLAPTMGNICPGGNVSFVNSGNNSPFWTYNWNFGDGTTSTNIYPNHVYQISGSYNISLSVTDDNGCTSTLLNGSQVIVYPQAHAAFTASSTSESTLDPTFSLYNFSSNSDTYIWNFGDGTSSTSVNPVHTYTEHGNYQVYLTANNVFNCPDSTFIILEVKPSFELFVPNAFTPDKDDYNETFFATGYGISDKDFTMYIFNRWGELVFESHAMNQGWDGSAKYLGNKSQDGVYTWVIYFKDLTEKKHKREGHVSILK